MIRYRTLMGTLFAAFSLTAIGCGPSLHKFDGIVTMDGKGVGGATVVFVPAEGTGTIGSAMTTAEGTFSMASSDPAVGIPAGPYKVTITKSAIVSGDAPNASDPNAMKNMQKMMQNIAKASKDQLPAKYSNATSTPLKVVVPPESQPLKLELTK